MPVVSCPTCSKKVEWSEANKYRPFCSERCKMIDLGAWATERYRVPVTETDDSEIPAEDLEDNRPQPN